MSKPNHELYKGLDKDSLKLDCQRHMRHTLAKDKYSATEWDYYRSVVFSVLDRLHDRWLETQRQYYEQDMKRVYYISMEYLIGRLLDNSLINLGIKDEVKQALEELGLDYEEIRETEWDAGLGNGGLGRLAACFLDSMATMGLPGYGYGIRYDYGMFYQRIQNGQQIEAADQWLRYGNPWDLARPKVNYPVHFFGESVPEHDEDGNVHFRWQNTQVVRAMAYDTPIPGYNNDVVNNLRLWKALSPASLDLPSFNQGDYIDAIRDIQLHENISRVLYPNDKVFVGQQLRLQQEYFLVAATLQDIIRRFLKKNNDWRKLPEKVAIQCNDTHPNLAVPELMRILLDEQDIDWDTAWDITTKTISYTNHTVLPEALEKWPVPLLRNLLPRHLQIIYEINKRFLDHVRANLGDDTNRIRRMSIIGDGEQPTVQMATLGIVGSHKVNGVAALHTELIKKTIFKDFFELYPEKFTNKTNGITPRRWLKQCNPRLSALINEQIGNGWATHLSKLEGIDHLADDPSFRKQYIDVKQKNKKDLADFIYNRTGIEVNTESIFDIQVKRIHEYKRQLLVALHTIALYNRIKANPDADFQPRTVIFAGKAAPGYTIAKSIIHLINDIGEKINNDPEVGDKLKCIFLSNYNVSLAERLVPAADLSEQTSTAGFEASGTGNMKFALNGALTIGTLDGANIEIKDEVGDDNIFIFGLTVDDIERMRIEGYNPRDYYQDNEELKTVIDQIHDGFFSPDDPDRYRDLIHNLLDGGDYFLVLPDYQAYADKQKEIEKVYQQPEKWFKMAIHNTARMGKFSSDRTITDYAEEIWGAKPVEYIPLDKDDLDVT